MKFMVQEGTIWHLWCRKELHDIYGAGRNYMTFMKFADG